jgi:hypothetical protein
MLYAKITNGKVEQIASLKGLFPNGDLSNMSPDWLANHTLLPVVDNLPYDPSKEKLVSITPRIEGGKVLAVEVQKLTSLDKENKLNQVFERIRTRRNQLLAASDYTQLPDNTHPKKFEWAVYRQALRDLPQQPGFPTVDFPKDPNYVEPVKPTGISGISGA